VTTDEQRLEDDLAARRDALDVSRSFIIQAPAGSGKTELLIQRYLSLLAVVEHPEEVIAITFTRKAAAEMQLRVLQALSRAQSADVPAEEHAQKTYQLAADALLRSGQRQWDLISNPRRMRILTLDRLNASIAKMQPLSQNGSGARIVVGAELGAVRKAASIATLDWLTDSGDMQTATIEVLQHVDNNTELYTSYLSQMLATRDQWLPFVGSGLLNAADANLLRERFEQGLEFVVTENLQRVADRMAGYAELAELFDDCAANLRESGDGSSPICELATLTELPAPTAGKITAWKGVVELLLTQKGQLRKTVNVRQGFPSDDKEKKGAMLALLVRMTNDPELAESLRAVTTLPPVRYDDEQWTVLLALFRLLPLAVVELRRLFSEQGIVDHTDIAMLAADALGTAEQPGDIALLLDYQIKHLLVDEMQDTSAAQYRMLETMTSGWQPGDGRSLCCVGDPMQSVYRFRNAEVGQFLLAQEFGIGPLRLQRLVLRRNFRSGEKLVDWFNAVFPSILARKDDPLRGAVSYASAVAVPQLKGQGRCIVHPIFGADNRDEANAGCRLIAKTLADNPGDDMAVLVRGRTQLPLLLAQLRAAGIPYRAVEIDRLTDLPEIIEVLAVTRAAAHPGDRIAWLAILRAPWIGLDWADLHALVRNDTGSSVWELLQDRQRLNSLSEPAQRALQNARGALTLLTGARCTQSLRDLVEQVWFALGGPAAQSDDYAIDNVYRYLDVLGKLERAGTVVDVGELESVLDQERVSSNDPARLQIMTMHRAKGLQFDHVLLYNLGRQPRGGDRRVLSWLDLSARDDGERRIISPVGPRSEVDKDPVHRYIGLADAEKARYELARLLYVACTRARKSLHLMGHTTLATNRESFKPARRGSLLHSLWPAVEADFSRAFLESDGPSVREESSLWAMPALRRFSTPWVLPEVAMMPGMSEPLDTHITDSEVEFYWVGSDARIAGTFIHRWFQLIAGRRADNLIDELIDDTAALRETTKRWLLEAGIAGDSAATVLARVENAVSVTLNDERGRWILNGDGHAELALTGVHEGELVSVVLDRVLLDDGTHWIVDYKSSSHEGGNLQGFLRAESARYQSQLARYASLYTNWVGADTDVRCALYFPLLASFVEVSL